MLQFNKEHFEYESNEDKYLDYEDDLSVTYCNTKQRKIKKTLIAEQEKNVNVKRKAVKYLLNSDFDRLDELFVTPPFLLNQPIDNNGNTLLHLAARSGLGVEFLLKQNADMFVKNSKRKTPYDLCRNEAVQSLFSKHAYFRKFNDLQFREAHMPTPNEIQQEMWEIEWLARKREVRCRRRLSAFYANKARERYLGGFHVIDQVRRDWKNCEICNSKVIMPIYEFCSKIFCSQDCFQLYRKG